MDWAIMLKANTESQNRKSAMEEIGKPVSFMVNGPVVLPVRPSKDLLSGKFFLSKE